MINSFKEYYNLTIKLEKARAHYKSARKNCKVSSSASALKYSQAKNKLDQSIKKITKFYKANKCIEFFTSTILCRCSPLKLALAENAKVLASSSDSVSIPKTKKKKPAISNETKIAIGEFKKQLLDKFIITDRWLIGNLIDAIVEENGSPKDYDAARLEELEEFDILQPHSLSYINSKFIEAILYKKDSLLKYVKKEPIEEGDTVVFGKIVYPLEKKE